MPAPVEFSITMSALPAGFTGDPQELADAIAARLTITPSEPWSSFINGGAEPTSDVGPWLKLGQEWKVWDVGLAAYTYHVQNGAGIVDGTITAAKFAPGAVSGGSLADGSVTEPKLAANSVSTIKIVDGNVTTAKIADGNVTTLKIADGNVTVAKIGTSTPKGVLTFNTGGVAVTTAAGTDGWVLTQSASGPVFAALPAGSTPNAGKNIFKAEPSGNQDVAHGGAGTIDTDVNFGTIIFDPDANFGSSVFTAPTDGYYLFTGSIQMSVPAGAATLVAGVAQFVSSGGVSDFFNNGPDGEEGTAQRFYSGTTIMFLTTGQTVKVSLSSTVDGAATVRIGTNSYFAGQRCR